MDSHESETWPQIAHKVDTLIRAYGREQFRAQTREAASEYVAACKKRKSRREQRLDLLKKNSVLHGVEDLPDRRDDKTKWFAWEVTIHGGLIGPFDFELPPQRPVVPDEFDPFPPDELDDKQQELLASFNAQFDDWRVANDKYLRSKSTRESRLAVFRLAKERGFPNEIFPENTKCYFKYNFELLCWIPVELSPDLEDPNCDLPFPVPDRKLKLAEKFAGLSALYYAHWKGEKKIAPWGTMPDEAEVRSGLPHSGVEEDQSHQANWYYWLVRNAKELDVKDMPIVESWLADVGTELLKRNAEPNTADNKPRVTAEPDDDSCGEIVDVSELAKTDQDAANLETNEQAEGSNQEPELDITKAVGKELLAITLHSSNPKLKKNEIAAKVRVNVRQLNRDRWPLFDKAWRLSHAKGDASGVIADGNPDIPYFDPDRLDSIDEKPAD